mgnify:CR=1 FL=1
MWLVVPPVRLMGDLGPPWCQARQIVAHYALGSSRTSARPTWSDATSRPSPRVGCGSPTFPHCVGGTPSYVRTMSGRVHVAFARRRLLPEDHRLADHLPASVHRPGPGRPGDGRLATKANRGRPDGPGAPLATAACSTGPSATGQALSEAEAVASVGSKGDLLSASLWPRL